MTRVGESGEERARRDNREIQKAVADREESRKQGNTAEVQRKKREIEKKYRIRLEDRQHGSKWHH